MHCEPDSTILSAVLAGDESRFGDLVRRYHRGLWRTASSRLGNETLADDAVQETFLAAFRSLATYDSRFSFRTWLWTILLNQCRRAMGKIARRREIATGHDDLRSLLAKLYNREPGPRDTLEQRETIAQLHALLTRLPDAEADALRMRFFGELAFQEIADVLGCSLGTAKNRVRRGLLQLSQWLGDDASPLNFSAGEHTS